MFTIFTIPRAFDGHAGVIQRNAIESWRRLHPEIQIVLCADDPGVDAVAAEMSVEHIPSIDRSAFGTPYLDSAFAKIRQAARYPLLCHVNTDIILTGSLVRAVRAVRSTGTSLDSSERRGCRRLTRLPVWSGRESPSRVFEMAPDRRVAGDRDGGFGCMMY